MVIAEQTDANPRPSTAADEYLDRVSEALPRVRERSAEAEALGSMPAATVAELDECGLFVGLQPARWGGLELDPASYFKSIVLLGSACRATGWVGGVLGAHPWEVACMDPDAQADVWAANHRARVNETSTRREAESTRLVDRRPPRVRACTSGWPPR